MYHSHSLLLTILFFVVFLITVVIKLLKNRKTKKNLQVFYPSELSEEATELVSTAVEKRNCSDMNPSAKLSSLTVCVQTIKRNVPTASLRITVSASLTSSFEVILKHNPYSNHFHVRINRYPGRL